MAGDPLKMQNDALLDLLQEVDQDKALAADVHTKASVILDKLNAVDVESSRALTEYQTIQTRNLEESEAIHQKITERRETPFGNFLDNLNRFIDPENTIRAYKDDIAEKERSTLHAAARLQERNAALETKKLTLKRTVEELEQQYKFERDETALAETTVRVAGARVQGLKDRNALALQNLQLKSRRREAQLQEFARLPDDEQTYEMAESMGLSHREAENVKRNQTLAEMEFEAHTRAAERELLQERISRLDLADASEQEIEQIAESQGIPLALVVDEWRKDRKAAAVLRTHINAADAGDVRQMELTKGLILDDMTAPMLIDLLDRADPVSQMISLGPGLLYGVPEIERALAERQSENYAEAERDVHLANGIGSTKSGVAQLGRIAGARITGDLTISASADVLLKNPDTPAELRPLLKNMMDAYQTYEGANDLGQLAMREKMIALNAGFSRQMNRIVEEEVALAPQSVQPAMREFLYRGSVNSPGAAHVAVQHNISHRISPGNPTYDAMATSLIGRMEEARPNVISAYEEATGDLDPSEIDQRAMGAVMGDPAIAMEVRQAGLFNVIIPNQLMDIANKYGLDQLSKELDPANAAGSALYDNGYLNLANFWALRGAYASAAGIPQEEFDKELMAGIKAKAIDAAVPSGSNPSAIASMNQMFYGNDVENVVTQDLMSILSALESQGAGFPMIKKGAEYALERARAYKRSSANAELVELPGTEIRIPFDTLVESQEAGYQEIMGHNVQELIDIQLMYGDMLPSERALEEPETAYEESMRTSPYGGVNPGFMMEEAIERRRGRAEERRRTGAEEDFTWSGSGPR